MTPPSTSETITGSERLGWSQRAADASELATVRYAIYVDGARAELAGVSCDGTALADGFACSARLPAMSAGAHTLELASFVMDGSVLESARSSALRVTVAAVAADASTATRRGPEPIAWPEAAAFSIDGESVSVDLVASDLHQPTDLAFAPDGRLFVAERGGTIRSVRDHTRSAPMEVSESFGADDRLLAIAVDPDFIRTRFVFAIYASHGTASVFAASRLRRDQKAGREMTFTLIRVREVSETLGERTVLLEGIRASASTPSASLRFGADAKLYAAFDDGGAPQRAGDLASSNGKLLRMNADGTTPDDQAGASPLFASGFRMPAGFDWQPQTRALWVADRFDGAISAVRVESGRAGPGIRGVVDQRWSLPVPSRPSGAAFVRGNSIPALAGNLLIASDEGRHLLRVRFDPLNPSRIAATETLLQDLVGPIVAVASGPEGAIYFATPQSIGRLVPAQ